MSARRLYILDSDVFIAAKNSYYAFTICPGFWDSLVRQHEAGSVCSIDRIRGELLAGQKTQKQLLAGETQEDLVQWVKEQLPVGFFVGTDTEAVVSAFEEVMLWVQRNPQYLDPAKAKFATEADGWLVAYAMVHDVIVVTNEQPRPQSRSRILLPDVCVQFDVKYGDTFSMLIDLGVQFENRSAR